MTVFANKQTFNRLGLERGFRQSHAHASQDCSICLQPLAVHPTKDDIPDPKSHTAVRIAACGHIVGKDCLDIWLDVGHTCPICNRLLFEATCDPITQDDIDIILRTLGPDYGEDTIMAVVARLMARQEQEHVRLRQAHEVEMEKEKEKMKAKETQAKDDGFALSDEDFLDSDNEMDFEEASDDEKYEAGEDG
jgi:hypothetical protein